MREQNTSATFLHDYTAPEFLLQQIDLYFDLNESETIVKGEMKFRKSEQSAKQNTPLILNGVDLKLNHILLNGEALPKERYSVEAERLIIYELPETFTLTIENTIKPQENTSLLGLYKTDGLFCTQCEAHGFSRIIYYPDRPDIMAKFNVTIEADQTRYPVLLTNGNVLETGSLDNGRHWAKWQDPFKKPAYLFALVAGDLSVVEDSFTTCSGRNIDLKLYVEPVNKDRCAFALTALKQAMAWDEKVYGREYDLDHYLIVAVNDFNFGAMENKGLNIFNAKYVLADPHTATDNDYLAVQSVVAHEYFHNWSGNRVTLRDWFQLSLKEGFTVYRDQSFSADMNSAGVKRIEDAHIMQRFQFVEDAGPMAHPVRPLSYIEMNNFYTVTVYNKGAEVVRMLHTLLGDAVFRQGTDTYFERHDGEAVTTDDFVRAMEDASGRDFSQFRRWYDQAGTPELKVNWTHDNSTDCFNLSVEQVLPSVKQAENINLQNYLIPLKIALLDQNTGEAVPLQIAEDNVENSLLEKTLEITDSTHHFKFTGIKNSVVPSLLRDFSAPVKLHAAHSDTDLAFLMRHDNDAYGRWAAKHRLMKRFYNELILAFKAGRELKVSEECLSGMMGIVDDNSLDPALAALLLALPTNAEIADDLDVVDVDAVTAAVIAMRVQLSDALLPRIAVLYDELSQRATNELSQQAIGERSYKNCLLAFLFEQGDQVAIQRCWQQYEQAKNMTDKLSALTLLTNYDGAEREQALASFYQEYEAVPWVIDKWLAIQACTRLNGALDQVKSLCEHPSFSFENPNKVRALIGSFCLRNHTHFHDESGVGYKFAAEAIVKMDSINPLVSARLASCFSRWTHYDSKRQSMMHEMLARILAIKGLSKDVYEIASKSIEAAG